MLLFKKKDDLRGFLDKKTNERGKVGFVPTMGALHEGHISLVERSRQDNSITVCSIFVNPTQFNDPKDFEKYPITIEQDLQRLEQSGCDLLFLPSGDEIYPNGLPTTETYELGIIETILEGKYRPGHFQGVCMVMKRLLDIVRPDNLYLGQKDYQQCMVIKKPIRDFFPSTQVDVCPIIREPDGLAMSSRNKRLDNEARKQAPAIYRALKKIGENIGAQTLQSLKTAAAEDLEDQGFKVDYVEIADAATLQPITDWNRKQKSVALAAAFLGDVRLIDNLKLNE
jgi:pantoate--beta-alanine ligase